MTKLCPRGKAAAKRKFAVYPSAYANAYASKICAGKIKDPSGVKRKDFKGPKKAALGAMMIGKKMVEEKMPIGGAAMALKKRLMGKSKGGGADMGSGRMKAKAALRKTVYALAKKRKNKDRMTKKDIETATSIIKKQAKPFNKGGLKAELNNPAKGYTVGGMADYYKDLM